MNAVNAVSTVHPNRTIARNSTYAASPASRSSRVTVLRPTAPFAAHKVVGETARNRTSGTSKQAVEPRDLRVWQREDFARREIAWFYTSETMDEASRDARERIALYIQALDDKQQETLALRYEPLPCPRSLEEHWGQGGFALALSLAFAGPWRPYGRPRHSLEREASDQLEEAVERHGIRVLDHIQSRAEQDFASALAAYTQIRGAAPCMIPSFP